MRPRKKKLVPLYKYERKLRKELLHEYHHQMYLGVTRIEGIRDTMNNIMETDAYKLVIGRWKTVSRLISRLLYSYHATNGKPTISTGDKILALAILRQKPKIYHFLRTIFKLPDPKTLLQLQKTPQKTEIINKNMLKRLKNHSIYKMDDFKFCSLLFGEVKMRNIGKQKDIYIQVYTIRGLVQNYKQAVAYTFSSTPIKPTHLAFQIKTVIKQLRTIGYKVLATVCKHSTKNHQAIKILKTQSARIWKLNNKEPKENVFLVNPQEVIPIFDPPHLLMSTRDVLIKNNLVFTKDGKTQTAQWDHIVLMEKANCHENNSSWTSCKISKWIDKLFDYHVIPEKIKRDSFSYATAVFSQKLAAWMAQFSGAMTKDSEVRKRVQKLPMESRQTAELILFFNNLFDSFSGEKKKSDYDDFNKLLKPLTLKSQHYKCWKEALEVLKTMYFVNKDGRQIKAPVIQCWIETIKGMTLLISKLKKSCRVNSLWTRRVTLDPLASYFKAVRSVCRIQKKRSVPFVKITVKVVKKKKVSHVKRAAPRQRAFSTSCTPF